MLDAFGSWLRGVRLEQKKTLEEVAKAAMISESYLSDIERSRRDAPSDDVLDFLAVALGVDRDVIFFRAGRLTPDVRWLLVPNEVILSVFRDLRMGAFTELRMP